jgi:hypothetical protein
MECTKFIIINTQSKDLPVGSTHFWFLFSLDLFVFRNWDMSEKKNPIHQLLKAPDTHTST